MEDPEIQNEPQPQPPQPSVDAASDAGTEPVRCKACDQPAQPRSMFCKDHQDKLVQKHRKRWVTRADVVLLFCMLALLVGYPRLVGPPRTVAGATDGWAAELGQQIMAGAELIGLAKAQRAQQAAPEAAEDLAALGLSSNGVPRAALANPSEGGKAADCMPAPDRHNSPALAALSTCGNGVIEPGEDCDGPALGAASCKSLGFSGDCGQSEACVRPGLACLRSCTFDYSGCTNESEAALQRFVSNGDGTITDRLTGLMWEQKCTELACPEPHQVFATLPWRASATQWVNALNEQRFAGHDDWRLPSLEELRTLLAANPPCASEPCPGAALPRGETAAAGYWTSTTFAIDARRAWAVSFADGDAYTAEKAEPLHVRAVRRGS